MCVLKFFLFNFMWTREKLFYCGIWWNLVEILNGFKIVCFLKFRSQFEGNVKLLSVRKTFTKYLKLFVMQRHSSLKYFEEFLSFSELKEFLSIERESYFTNKSLNTKEILSMQRKSLNFRFFTSNPPTLLDRNSRHQNEKLSHQNHQLKSIIN